MSTIIPFEVANRAVAHLGRHLYGSVPPALAELVANSYDAYARNVDILHQDLGDDFGECVVVADDGIGMNLQTLTRDYAQIGQQKGAVPVPEGMELRSPMGKKGIGKLAAFSIGESYSVYTRTAGEPAWHYLSLNYKDLLESKGTYKAKCVEVDLPEQLARFAQNDSGCIVIIRQFRHQWRKSTETGFETRLSRRFYIASGKAEFSLRVNDKPISLSKNSYYDKLKVIVYFGYGQDEIDSMFSADDARIDVDLLASTRLTSKEEEQLSAMVDDNGVKGWLGFARHPKDLFQNKEENFSNVIVYINGKIADDDFLKHHPDSTFASKYMVGEVLADYLGATGDFDDVVTSSRQGLDNDSERVRQLLDFILMVRSKSIAEWNESSRNMGAEDLPEFIAESTGYDQWVDGLDPAALKFHNGIVRCVKTLVDSKVMDGPEEVEATVKALVNGSIEMVELSRESDLMDRVEQALEEGSLDLAVEQLISVLGKINASEAYSVWQVASSRIEAIEQLQRLIDSDAVEKEFQKLLGENPWIIDPTWKPVADPDESFEVKREAFKRVRDGLGDEYRRNFIDILISKRVGITEECAVVELKRNKVTPHSRVTCTDIMTQVGRYREAILENDPDRNLHPEMRPSDIPAYFIIPSDSGPVGSGRKLEFSADDRNVFKTLNIVVMSYDELLNNCKRVLHEERAIMSSFKGRPFFGMDLRLES